MIKQGEVFYLVTDEDSGISKERRFSEEKAP